MSRLQKMLFATTLVLGFWSPLAIAQKHVTTIDKCTVIDKPGAYLLGKVIQASERDLTPVPGFPNTACILITSDFVTLDLGGNTIIGPGRSIAMAAGVWVQRVLGVKVHSGNITNFFGGLGSLGTASRIEHISAFDTEFGIQVIGQGSHLIGNTAYRNELGITVGGAGSRAIGNIALANSGRGIEIVCPSVVLENAAFNNPPGNDIVIIQGVDCTREHNNPFAGDQP
jgi:hypothetical protein